MTRQRPLLLLSNDDGVNAKGLRDLIRTLCPLADLMVVAPDGPRSGSSGSITSENPLRAVLVEQKPGIVLYKCSGTPVDCVKLALHSLVPRTPDMVIGGINHGDNSSVNVHYSGTMGVVIEGCLKKIPSVGFSLCNHAADADFSAVLPYVRRITEQVLAEGLPAGTCLNVNFPDVERMKGVRVCRQTAGVWTQEFAVIDNPRGGKCYWLTGSFRNDEPDAEDSDRWALANGYVAITPTQIDMTAYALIDTLNRWNWEV